MTMTARLMLPMVGLVLLTALSVGLLVYGAVQEAIVPHGLLQVRSNVERLADTLEAQTAAARQDLGVLLAAGPVAGVARARTNDGIDPETGLAEDDWRRPLAALMLAELAAKQHYLQFRLIGVADGGREIIRVHRFAADEPPRLVDDADLQRKGDRDYVTETLRLTGDAVYVSALDLNREWGEVQSPHVPVLRIAAPVRNADGSPFGVLVLNLDMRPMLESVRRSTPPDGNLFVVNADGDFLMHPDRSREFGFDLGRRYRLQDDRPELARTVSDPDGGAAVVEPATGEELATAWADARLAGGPRVVVIETIPSSALAAGQAVQRSALMGGAAVACVALLLAAGIARSVARPLVQMTHAVEAATAGKPAVLPVAAAGEVGLLARTFADHIERERWYVAVIEDSHDAILTTRLDGVITRWNPGAERLYGYTAEEAVGRNMDLIVPQEHRQEMSDIRARVGCGEGIAAFETVRRARDGRSIDISLTVSPVRAADGEVIGVSAIARDVSDRKRAEEMFRLTVEACPTGMLLADESGRMILVNSEAERQFGYDRGELQGQTIDILVPDDVRSGHARLRDRFMAGPQGRRMGAGRELFGRRKDGSIFPVEIGLTPVLTPAGQLVLSAVVDISERTTARRELETAQRIANIGSFSANLPDKVAAWSPQLYEILGRDPASYAVTPDSFFEHVDADDRAAFEAAWEKMLTGGVTLDFAGRIVRADGQKRYVAVEGELAPSDGAQPVHLTATVQDVTEKRELELRLSRSQKLEAIGQLTGGVAHDFNNLLGVILGNIQLLDRSIDGDAKVKKWLSTAEHATLRGADLTKRLLAFSRQQVLESKWVLINEVIVGLEEMLRRTLTETIDIETSLEPELWATRVDPGELENALLNLVVNARDAMPDGGSLTIETANVVLDEAYLQRHGYVDPGDYVMLAISDTGTGIPEHALEHIFEPFFTTKAQGKGTGLGMSMVYGFVKQSGGHIEAYSEVGAGTTIKIYFPRLSEDRPADDAGAVCQASKIVDQGRNHTILVVEDDEALRDTLTNLLGEMGYDVVQAGDAAEALTTLDGGAKIDMIFTDYVMPGGMDGLELIRHARQRNPAVRALLTSGYTRRAILRKEEIGEDLDWVAKPYRWDEIATKLRAAFVDA